MKQMLSNLLNRDKLPITAEEKFDRQTTERYIALNFGLEEIKEE